MYERVRIFHVEKRVDHLHKNPTRDILVEPLIFCDHIEEIQTRSWTLHNLQQAATAAATFGKGCTLAAYNQKASTRRKPIDQLNAARNTRATSKMTNFGWYKLIVVLKKTK